MDTFNLNSYEEMINYLNEKEMNISITLNNAICYISNSLVIKGYIENEKDTNKVILEEDLFKIVKDFTLNATGALISVNNMSNRKVFDLVKDIYSNGFIVNEAFVEDYSVMVEIFMLLESLLSGVNNIIFISSFCYILTKIHCIRWSTTKGSTSKINHCLHLHLSVTA